MEKKFLAAIGRGTGADLKPLDTQAHTWSERTTRTTRREKQDSKQTNK